MYGNIWNRNRRSWNGGLKSRIPKACGSSTDWKRILIFKLKNDKYPQVLKNVRVRGYMIGIEYRQNKEDESV